MVKLFRGGPRIDVSARGRRAFSRADRTGRSLAASARDATTAASARRRGDSRSGDGRASRCRDRAADGSQPPPGRRRRSSSTRPQHRRSLQLGLADSAGCAAVFHGADARSPLASGWRAALTCSIGDAGRRPRRPALAGIEARPQPHRPGAALAALAELEGAIGGSPRRAQSPRAWPHSHPRDRSARRLGRPVARRQAGRSAPRAPALRGGQPAPARERRRSLDARPAPPVTAPAGGRCRRRVQARSGRRRGDRPRRRPVGIQMARIRLSRALCSTSARPSASSTGGT